MQTVQEAVKAVTDSVADEEVRVTRRIEIGSCVQQGDLYVHRVADGHACGAKRKKGKAQLALGTNMGARHVAEGDVEIFEGTTLPPGVKAPADIPASEICGPVIVAKRPFKVTHPEHAHHQLPEGTYQVTYQYDPRTIKRVVD